MIVNITIGETELWWVLLFVELCKPQFIRKFIFLLSACKSLFIHVAARACARQREKYVKKLGHKVSSEETT